MNSVIDNLVAASLVVRPSRPISVITDDPSDNMFLACALAAQASFIISGDRHILAVKTFRDIPIVTPAQFLTLFKNAS